MTSNDDPEKTGKPGEPAKRWHGKLPDRGFAVSFVLTMRQMAILALYAARLGEKISRSEIIRRMIEAAGEAFTEAEIVAAQEAIERERASEMQ